MMLFAVIGGLLGLFAGGLLGLILGIVVGLVVGDFMTRGLLLSGQGGVQEQFLDTTFAVMGALCKADGVVTSDEIRVAEDYFNKLALSPDQRRAARASFERGKCVGYDLYGEARNLRLIMRFNRSLLPLFLQIQISAVAADGVLHEDERRKLQHVTRALGLKDVDLASLEAMLRNASADTDQPQPARVDPDSAYTTLGVTSSASDAEVKRAYRRLMSKYHPDKFAARGLSENMREVARERIHEVRKAYDTIKEQRGGRL